MKIPVIAIVTAAFAMGAAGCTPRDAGADAAADPAHTARNALDWAGAYRGVLPCADCPGIETVVILGDDGTYSRQTRYLDGDGRIFTEQGAFAWNAGDSSVTLHGDQPLQYFVAENRLIALALDGSRIDGPLAENYVLTKVPDDGVTEKYWKLVELNGQPVPALEREPYLVLRSEGGQATGFGGCNGFGGGYTIDEAASRIAFGQLASTVMACAEGMDVEAAFHDALRDADNYSLNGDTLTLNRARMAPLARFEAVYLY